MKIKKKTAALLFACAWAVFALTASVAFRAVTAKAFSMEEMNDEIGIKVYSTLASVGDDTLCDWGIFYRGIELLTEISYETDDGTIGTATIEVVDEDNNFYTFTTDSNGSVTTNTDDYSKLVYEKPLDTTEDCAHDFIAGGDGSWTSIDDKTHWAECSSGDFKIQVAHRLNGNGVCMDCGYKLVTSANTYTFSGIPDYITNTPEDIDSTDMLVVNIEDDVATFEIEFTADLFLGSTLTLYLQCGGALTAGDANIPYTIEVSCEDVPSSGSLTTDSPVEDDSKTAIWTYTAPTEYEGDLDSLDPASLVANFSGTITITLTVLPGCGTFSDTLTFSAELITLDAEE